MITIRGTVTDIKPKRGFHPHLKWLVSLSVNAVITGDFEENMFHFFIHSPVKSGIVIGGQYSLQLSKKQEDEYELLRITSFKEQP